jgi:F0F1-type ATP synthase membrane subunit a
MPCAVKLYAYIFIANVLTVVIVTRWLERFGFVASIAFSLAFAYLTIVTGRSLFRRKEL